MPVVALGLAKISFILLDSLVFMAPPTAVQMYAINSGPSVVSCTRAYTAYIGRF